MASTALVLRGEGKGGHTPKEAPDSLFSNNIAHILDILGEGEIEGIVGTTDDERKQNIFYNEVAIKGPLGEVNHSGVMVQANYGTPDQAALPGFDNVATSVSVAQALPYGVYKTISFPNDGSITAVLVQIAATNFFEVTKDGDTVGTYVTFDIELSENGGAFELAYSGTIRGKQEDEYTVDYRVPVMDTAGNTAIRVKRTKVDASSLKVNDAISFKLYTKVNEHKFSYPNLACVGHTIDAKQFGNQLPQRQYRVRGLKCRIPHNYDPVTRTYTGPFTGALTTTKYYTSNPAWQMYEIVTNRRFGLGRFMSPTLSDIATLYQTGKWADDLVSDGKGGFEPRWTCNTVINTRGEAFNVLRELASCFRGAMFWMQAKLWIMGDQPRTPIKLVTNANVIDGKFVYSGESGRARASVINVSYNDPDLFFRRGIESVDDPDLVREIGYKPKDFGAFGCTSRAQARRLGRAILFSQEFESELVSYRASFDHMAVAGDGPDGVAPGDLVLLGDSGRGNAVAAGRVKSVAGAAITLDRTTPAVTSTAGTLYIEHDSGLLESRPCTYNGAVVTLGGAALTEAMATNDQYILIASGFIAEPFVVLKVAEEEPNVLGITAVKYDEDRVAAIYGDDHTDTTKYMSLPKVDQVAPVSAVNCTEAYVTGVDVYQRVIDISWPTPTDLYFSHCIVAYSKDNDNWVKLPGSGGTTARIKDARAGDYRVRVSVMNRAGRESAAVEQTITLGAVVDPAILPKGTITGLALQGGGTTFGGRDAKLTWQVITPQSQYMLDAGITGSASVDGLADPLFKDCLVTVKTVGGTLLRVESVIDTTYVYTYEKNFEDTAGSPLRSFKVSVQYRDAYGRVSTALTVTVNNAAPTFATAPVLTGLVGGIRVGITRPTDLDYAGMNVYASLTSGFTPGPGNLVYSGPDNAANFAALGAGLHYIRVLPYDAFGPGSTYTTEQSQAPLSVGGVNMLQNSNQVRGAWGYGFSEINDLGGPTTPSSGTGHSGGPSLRIDYTSNSNHGFAFSNSGGIDNTNLMVAGKTYQFSFWARAGGGTVGQTLTMDSYPNYSDLNPTTYSPALTGSYQRISVAVKWNIGSTVNNFLRAYTTSASSGWVEFSDIQLEEGDILTPYSPSVKDSQAIATAAQADATAALGQLTNIASDSILSQVEKPTVILDKANLDNEQSGIDAIATSFGITTEKTNYDTALSNLTSYLASLTSPVLWSNLGGDTTIVGTTFRTYFAAAYNTRQILLNKIADAAAKTQDYAPNLISPAGIAVACDYLGAAKSGQLPRTFKFTRKLGDTDVSSSTTWSVITASGNDGSVDSTGLVTITTCTGTGKVKVSSVRDGITLYGEVVVSKVDDSIPVSSPAGSGATSQSQGISDTVPAGDTTYGSHDGAAMTVRTGPSGILTMGASVDYTVGNSSPSGAFHLIGIWQYKLHSSGTWIDASSGEVNTSAPGCSPCHVVNEGGGIYSDSEDGHLQVNTTQSSLSASTDYDVRFRRRAGSGAGHTRYCAGTAGVVGS